MASSTDGWRGWGWDCSETGSLPINFPCLNFRVTQILSTSVLVFLKFGHFSCELKETGSLGATESEV